MEFDSPITIKYIKNEYGEFICPYCDTVKKNQNTMHYHIKTLHMGDMPYQCNNCFDCPRFVQKSAYLRHMAVCHPEDTSIEYNPYRGISVSCPCCSHSTNVKANLIVHYARIHCRDWIPPYSKSSPCINCNKYFDSCSAYLYHAVTCLSYCAPPDHDSIIDRINCSE